MSSRGRKNITTPKSSQYKIGITKKKNCLLTLAGCFEFSPLPSFLLFPESSVVKELDALI